jgi:hypothetical protein
MVKNISKAADIDTLQDRNEISITVIFWAINNTAMLDKMIINVSFKFILQTFRVDGYAWSGWAFNKHQNH